MKSGLFLTSALILGLGSIAIAQTPATTSAPPAAAAAPAGGRGPALPPPNPFPAGGSDNTSSGDYTIGPDYVIADELRPHAAWATGELHEFTMLAKDSKIYPGRKKKVGYVPDPSKAPGGASPNLSGANAIPGDVQWEASPYEPRHLWVYIPAGMKKGTPMPVIIVQDGNSYQSQVRRALDALISQGKLPPIVMVALDPGSTPVGAARNEDSLGSERGYEYDTVSGQYSDFIEKEVLPTVSKKFGITFTKDPDGRATLGGSSGAAAAFTMAWFHPERYHRVIVFSPTLVNQQSPYNPATPHGAWEYHDHLIAEAPKKPLRIWMEAGERDNGYQSTDSGFHNWVTAANRTAAALKAKGYEYRYVFAKDAGHTDNRVREQTIAAALEYAWAGYKPSKH